MDFTNNTQLKVLKQLGPLINRIVDYFPKKFTTLLKRIGEFSYWFKRMRTEGKNAFLKPDSLNFIFQKYCKILEITTDIFADKVVIDIGCGPRGSLHHFNGKTKIGIDPLARVYEIFFDVHKQDMIYVNSKAEKMPIKNNFADFIISENALDHVESFDNVIKEIHRVLKSGGKLISQISLNTRKTITEPTTYTYEFIEQNLKRYFTLEKIKKHSTQYHNIDFSESVLIVARK